MSALRFLTQWRGSVVAEPRPTARNRYSFANMALSIGVVLVVVVIVIVLLPRPHFNAVKPIDPTQAIRSAQRTAQYHVQVPTGLASTWQPTSANVYGPDEHHIVHLHIGYVTPRGAYAALEESNAEAKPFIRLESSHGKLTGYRSINGQVWDVRYAANQRDNTVNVTTTSGVTLVVTGSATVDELTELAASLR